MHDAGGVERLNQTIEKLISIWMSAENSWSWATVGVKLVRWQYNNRHHSAIGMMPYRALTGQMARVGISKLPLSPEVIRKLATGAGMATEEALIEALGLPPGTELETASFATDGGGGEATADELAAAARDAAMGRDKCI